MLNGLHVPPPIDMPYCVAADAKVTEPESKKPIVKLGPRGKAALSKMARSKLTPKVDQQPTQEEVSTLAAKGPEPAAASPPSPKPDEPKKSAFKPTTAKAKPTGPSAKISAKEPEIAGAPEDLQKKPGKPGVAKQPEETKTEAKQPRVAKAPVAAVKDKDEQPSDAKKPATAAKPKDQKPSEGKEASASSKADAAVPKPGEAQPAKAEDAKKVSVETPQPVSPPGFVKPPQPKAPFKVSLMKKPTPNKPKGISKQRDDRGPSTGPVP